MDLLVLCGYRNVACGCDGALEFLRPLAVVCVACGRVRVFNFGLIQFHIIIINWYKDLWHYRKEAAGENGSSNYGAQFVAIR